MHLHPLCFVLTRLAIYISIVLKLFSKKMIFSDNAKIIGRGDFQTKFPQGAIVEKMLKTTAVVHATTSTVFT